jgi:hypothetical protein
MRRHLLLGVCATLAACGGDSSTPRAPVETVTISPNPIEVDVGSTVQLQVTLRDADGNELTGREVAWSSSAEAIATVTADGLVEGVAEGTANIQAASEGKTAAAATAVSRRATPREAAGLFASLYNKDGSQTWGDALFEVAYIWDVFDLADPAPEDTKFHWTNFTAGMRSSLGGRGRPALIGNILFAGGYAPGPGFAATSAAVLVDPNTYETTPLEMNEPRTYHTMTQLPPSRILIAGGFDGDAVTNTAEIFDDATGQITLTGAMASARGRHAAAPLADGRVLITGGLVPVGAGPVTTDVATTEIYDPGAGTFSPGPDMSVARFNHSAIPLDDGRVLVLGGNQRSSAEVYDPVGNDFTLVGDMEVAHGLGHQTVKLADGRVLVVAGDAGTIQPSAIAEVFDPATDEFTRVGDLATPRMLHFAVLAAEGKVLVGGGQDDEGELLDSVEIYDPAAGTFSPAPPLPAADAEPAVVFIPREE